MSPDRPLFRLLFWPLLCLLTACAPSIELAPDPPDLVVLGVNGRRLADLDAYWVPLDAPERRIALGEWAREPLALRNEGGSPLTLEALWLTPLGDTLTSELTLLAPSRAQATPLAVDALRLGPGEQLDFDVAVRPRASGVRRAMLTIRWAEGADRRVELRARADGELRLHDPGWPTWPRPSWALAGRGPGGVDVVASALHHDNLYVTGRLHASVGRVVVRVAPEGETQWVTALEDLSLDDRRTEAAGLCAGPGGVVVVGREVRPGAEDAGASAVWLSHDGSVGWSRTWSTPGEAAEAARCVVTADRVWLLGVVRAVGGESIFAAAVTPHGELLGSWASPTAADPLSVRAAVAGRDGGVVLAGAAGERGFVARLEPGAPSVWHDLPGPVMALAPLERPGPLAVAWSASDRVVLTALDADGRVAWRRALPVSGQAALAASPGRVHALVAGSSGVTAFELEAASGAPRTAAHLSLPGPVTVHAVSTEGAGLRFALGDVAPLDGGEAWYQAEAPAAVAGPVAAPTSDPRFTARPPGGWVDTGPRTQAWDAWADVVVLPLGAANGVPFTVLVTGLPRPESE